MRLLMSAALVLVLGYLAMVGALYFLQRKLMYHPDFTRPMPAELGLEGVAPVTYESGDGLDLFAWWLPPGSPGAPVILYFHGNAGTLADREDKVRHFKAMGWGALMTTYRYNAGVGGDPTEDALLADAGRAVSWLEAQGIPKSRVVLFGESLGSGIAISLAADGVGAAVVVEGGYDAVMAVAQRKYWFAPVAWLMKDKFDSRPKARKSNKPILIVHGEQDPIIPLSHARALYAASNEPKELLVLPGREHVGLYDHGMKPAVERFISQHLAPDE